MTIDELEEWTNEALEAMSPDERKLELFARSRRIGWDCHGNEVPYPDGEY